MIKLDKIDKNLLFELDKDASASLSALSRTLRQSKQTLIYRMKRLEKEKIITGYKTVINMPALGYTTYRIYIKLQNLRGKTKEEIYSFLKNKKNVWSIGLMQGKWDVAIFFGVKTISELHDFFDNLMSHYKKNVKEYNFCIYEPIHFFARRFYLDEKKPVHEFVYGSGNNEKFNQTDIKIIEAIKNNPRIKMVNLADKVKVSLETAIRRMKLLKNKKIIIGSKVVLDYSKLNYVAYRVDFFLNDFTKKTEILDYCKNHKNIYAINETIGGADFEIALAVKDSYELEKIIQEIFESFKDAIRSYDYIGFTNFSFIEYIPD